MHTITTSQLVLEPLAAAHAEVMFDLLSEPQLYRYLDYPPPPSVEHLRNVYARLEARQSPDGDEIWLNWVVLAFGRQPVGTVQATVVSPGDAWIAYMLSSQYWGRGYAHMATRAMLAHLAEAYGVGRYLATVEVENLRSVRLLERLAFRPATPNEADGHGLTATERLFVR